MTTLHEAAQQAREALLDAKSLLNGKDQTTTEWFKEEIEALRSALAQPDDKDLLTIAAMDAYQMGKRDALAQQGEPVGVVDGLMRVWLFEGKTLNNGDKVYAAPSPQAQQEPVKFISVEHDHPEDRYASSQMPDVQEGQCGHCGNFDSAPAPHPDTRTVVQQMVDALEFIRRWGEPAQGVEKRDAAIAAGQKLLEELK